MVNNTIRVSVGNKADKANTNWIGRTNHTRTTRGGVRESFRTDVPATEEPESVESLKRSMAYKNQPDSE